ncbi:G-type lectin S-receptor-like serine/threonine-protein kinase CES101 [Juglans microcarpa x Juglans regia]|uniref:G-type lectin S-receptor-like serine/threonine-protein kinase CES101 n=1 Tax=Juglans microcarpa x Juglans regia TaxID=2249226 RepID=UPI001B7F0DE6|nr:G-type lectin S-receptor-like serine/threonine-protein kinase CES101 [Juglans microcarpa x Juglans regia]
MAKLRSLMLFLISCLCIEYPYSSCQEYLLTLKQGQQIRVGEHLLSAAGLFKLGFFKPGSSSYYYLGIWYSKLPHHPESVWVANQDDPITDSSGVLTLDDQGLLKIARNGGQAIVINPNQAVSSNVTATLLDSGNLVIEEVDSNGTVGRVLWESFNYPTNTLLPGMRLGMNPMSGYSWALNSWLSDQIPAPGAFRLGVDPGSANQLIIWKREDIYWTSVVWNNGRFQNMAPDSRTYEFSFVSNEDEKYFSYSVKDNSTISRWELNSWGQILQFTLASDGTTWQNTTTSPCKFNVNHPNAVCIQQNPTECRNSSELFVPAIGYYKEQQLVFSNSNSSLALSDCHTSCWNNCSCIAYGTHFDNGTGCEFWSKGASFIRNPNFNAVYILSQGNSTEGTPTGGTEEDSGRSIKHLWWIVVIAPALAMLFVGYFCYKRRIKQNNVEGETSQDKALIELRSLPLFRLKDKIKRGTDKGHNFQLYSFSEISALTESFSLSNKLGEGGFGPVYKGVLLDGQHVAVKRLARNSGQGLEEFMNEITLIAELQHVNLVTLLGCCIHENEKILIYEYMPNKSLDSFIFDPTKKKLLDWRMRTGIIEGVAQGLLYLHKYSRLKIIHRDLKASNILLGNDMNPKISDFGMARIFGENESRANTKRVVGTYGYMSPEYAMNGIFSVKSDVYSFGVLLLEIVSGRKNTIFSSSGILALIEQAWDLWKQGDILEFIDPYLDSSCPRAEVFRYIHVGLLCVQESAADRPTMSDIIPMFTNEGMFLPEPKQPAYSIGRSEAGSTLPDGKLVFNSVNCVSISVMEAR